MVKQFSTAMKEKVEKSEDPFSQCDFEKGIAIKGMFIRQKLRFSATNIKYITKAISVKI